VQNLWNDTRHSDYHHSHSDQNFHERVNGGNLGDYPTQAGDTDHRHRIHVNGRSQKHKAGGSTHSVGDTLTGDRNDDHKQSSCSQRGKDAPAAYSWAGNQSSSFTRQHRQHADRPHYSHRDHVVRRWHECRRHFDENKSGKICHCDEHSGHRNHSARRSRSRDKARHHSYRSSSHHTTRRQGHYSRH